MTQNIQAGGAEAQEQPPSGHVASEPGEPASHEKRKDEGRKDEGKVVESKEEVAYGEVREEVDNGDVLCFKGSGFVSAAIRAMTKSEYSHVGLVYLFEGRKYCLEAVGTGVRLMLLSELVKHYHGGIDYFEMRGVTREHRCQAISFGFQQLGKLYDRAGLFRFFWYIMTKKKREANLDDVWFCSEIVAEAYGRQGVEICGSTASYTSPSDIACSERLLYRYTIKSYSDE